MVADGERLLTGLAGILGSLANSAGSVGKVKFEEMSFEGS
jgi:hypothetical protein